MFDFFYKIPTQREVSENIVLELRTLFLN